MTRRVLIVDDEPDAAALFQQQFRRELRQGLYAFEFALSSVAALDQLARDAAGAIGLMIVDITLPGMSGLELLIRVRAQRPGLPVIMISAHDDPANVARALEQGANLFLGKPVDFPRLRQDIARLIGDSAAPNT